MTGPFDPARRRWIRAAGAAGMAAAVPAAGQVAPTRAAPRYVFLAPHEASFIEAATARLIPDDELGPGALRAGVPRFIDLQLAGPWGRGERLYRSGPWRKGTPSQGYQLRYTPAELFRAAIRAIDANVEAQGSGRFAALPAEEQDRYLEALENDRISLEGLPAQSFFEALLDLTREGYFSDPVYGGNRGMAGWKLIGFPGAYAHYYELVDRYGIAFRQPPMSLAQDAHGVVHVQPVAPLPPRKTRTQE